MKQSVRGRAGTASGLSRKLLALAAAGAVAVVMTTSTDRVAVAQDEARFECPREDVAKTGCRGPKDCLYPGLDDLNSYTACTPNPDGVTGTAKTMPCPGDLEWNDDKKECDYPGQGTGALAGLLDTALTADSTMHPRDRHLAHHAHPDGL